MAEYWVSIKWKYPQRRRVGTQAISGPLAFRPTSLGSIQEALRPLNPTHGTLFADRMVVTSAGKSSSDPRRSPVVVVVHCDGADDVKCVVRVSNEHRQDRAETGC